MLLTMAFLIASGDSLAVQLSANASISLTVSYRDARVGHYRGETRPLKYLLELDTEQRHRLEVSDTLRLEPRLDFLNLDIRVIRVGEDIGGLRHR